MLNGKNQNYNDIGNPRITIRIIDDEINKIIPNNAIHPEILFLIELSFQFLMILVSCNKNALVRIKGKRNMDKIEFRRRYRSFLLS